MRRQGGVNGKVVISRSCSGAVLVEGMVFIHIFNVLCIELTGKSLENWCYMNMSFQSVE